MTDETVAYMGWGISAQEQIDGFRKEVRELKAENAKLREEIKVVGTVAYVHGMKQLRDENDKLRELIEEDSEQLDEWQKKAEYYSQLSQLDEAENAKLRELVKITYAYLAWADGATFSDGRPAVHACDRCEVEDRMRELGVEVD